jgi:hypothetical protein
VPDLPPAHHRFRGNRPTMDVDDPADMSRISSFTHVCQRVYYVNFAIEFVSVYQLATKWPSNILWIGNDEEVGSGVPAATAEGEGAGPRRLASTSATKTCSPGRSASRVAHSRLRWALGVGGQIVFVGGSASASGVERSHARGKFCCA